MQLPWYACRLYKAEARLPDCRMTRLGVPSQSMVPRETRKKDNGGGLSAEKASHLVNPVLGETGASAIIVGKALIIHDLLATLLLMFTSACWRSLWVHS